MARPKKYHVSLTDEDIKRLKIITRKKDTSRTLKCRCQILLDLDEAHGKAFTHEQSAKSNGVCMATVTNTAKQYCEEGLDSTLNIKRNYNSDHARRKVDGRAEAKLIEIACGPVPDGHARWTLRLLEERAHIELDVPVSKDTIGRVLKKQTSTSQKRLLVHSPKRKCRIHSLYGRCS